MRLFTGDPPMNIVAFREVYQSFSSFAIAFGQA
jgi:hypothetical protein